MVSLSENIKGLNGWCENAHRRIKTITSQLSEIESLLDLDNKLPENDINLMEILKLIDYIEQQHKTVINIITSEKEKNVNEMTDDLQNQLEILNRTFKLLQMEAGNLSPS